MLGTAALRPWLCRGIHHKVVCFYPADLWPCFLVLPIPLCNASPVCLCSPHPVKPLSAAPVEGSPDKKQSRSSLSTALSSGLEKLKTVTSGSVQTVAPAPQVGQTVDTKRLKVRPSRMPGGIRQDQRGCEVRNRALGRVEEGAGLAPSLKPRGQLGHLRH